MAAPEDAADSAREIAPAMCVAWARAGRRWGCGQLSAHLTGPVALELAKAVDHLPGEHGVPASSGSGTGSFTEGCQLVVSRGVLLRVAQASVDGRSLG